MVLPGTITLALPAAAIGTLRESDYGLLPALGRLRVCRICGFCGNSVRDFATECNTLQPTMSPKTASTFRIDDELLDGMLARPHQSAIWADDVRRTPKVEGLSMSRTLLAMAMLATVTIAVHAQSSGQRNLSKGTAGVFG